MNTAAWKRFPQKAQVLSMSSRKIEQLGATELLAILLNKLGGAAQVTQFEVDNLPTSFTIHTQYGDDKSLMMVVEDKGAILQ